MNAGTNASGRGGVVSALFRDPAQGGSALADLKAAGFDRAEISQVSADDDSRRSAPAAAAASTDDAQRSNLPSL